MTFESILFALNLSAEDAITMMAGIVAFLSVFILWNGLVARPANMRRVRELAARREQLRQGLQAPARRRRTQASMSGFMRQFVDKLNLQRNHRAESITLKLARAGWRNNDAMVAFLFFKVALPALLGVAAAIVFYFGGAYDLSPPMRMATIGGGLLLGFMIPDIIVRNAIAKRGDKIRKSLPDALDLMVICAEAGLSLDAMLKRVSDEFSRGGPELADELVLTSIELGFLPDRKQALANLNLRTNQPGIRALCNALSQCEKFGTPLALSMRVLSAEFREERMLKAEEKAARLPALLTVPMIMFILPPLFVVLMGPAVLRLIDAFTNIN